jgi:hypothetical protein
MNARIAIVAVLIASLLAVFVVWRATSSGSNGSPIAAADGDATASSAVDASKPLETSTSDESEKLGERQVAIDSKSTTAAAPAPSADEPAGDAALVVQCRSKPSGNLLEGIRVIAGAKDESISSTYRIAKGSRGSLSNVPITGANGEVEFALPSGIELEIRTKPNWSDTPAVRQDVSALARGECRKTVLEIPSGDDLEFHGIVVAADILKPIAGARVRVVTSMSWAPRPSPRDSQNANHDPDAITRDDGRFEVSACSWKYPYLSIEADGYGVVLVALDKLHATEEQALTIGVKLAASIDATVVDGAGSPVVGVVVRASASGNELKQHDGFREYSDSVSWASVPWSATTGANGICSLKSLTPDVQLSFSVLRDGKLVSPMHDRVRLNPGEVRAVRLEIGGGCTIEGVLVGEGSTPIGGRIIWLERANEWAGSSHYLEDAAIGTVGAKTDASGHFTFSEVRSGRWWVGLAPTNADGTKPSDDALVPLAQIVEIPVDVRRVNVEIHAQCGVYIRGRVIDAEGHGAGSRRVSAWSENELATRTTTKEDGGFMLGPLGPGRFRVNARGKGSELDGELASVDAGEENVVLRVGRAASIEGRVLDAVTHQGCVATISLLVPESSRGSGRSGEFTGSDGSFNLRGIEPGTYDLLARVKDGRIAIQHGVGVSAGKKVNGIVMLVEPGSRLHLRYTGKAQEAMAWIHTQGVWLDSVTLQRGITSDFFAPKGPITLQLFVGGAMRTQPRELYLDPGEEREIVFNDDG